MWESGTPTRPVGPTMGPPTHLRSTASPMGISLRWTANTLADHYRIFRGTAAGSETYWGGETCDCGGGCDCNKSCRCGTTR